MTYAATDVTVHDGNVREIFEFVDGEATYRYVSGDVSTTFQAQTYSPLPILRTSLDVTSFGPGQDFTVELPVSATVVQAHIRLPPPELLLTITRMHADNPSAGDYVVFWEGKVLGFEVRGPLAIARCVSTMDDALRVGLPAWRDAVLCQNRLFDAQCSIDGLDEAAYDFSTTVNGTPSGRTLVVTSANSKPDDWFRAGRIREVATGYERTIVKQVGTTLTLNAPFLSIADTDDVVLFAGCMRRIAEDCRDKFANAINHNATPYISVAGNPFVIGMRKIAGGGGTI